MREGAFVRGVWEEGLSQVGNKNAPLRKEHSRPQTWLEKQEKKIERKHCSKIVKFFSIPNQQPALSFSLGFNCHRDFHIFKNTSGMRLFVMS